MARVIKKSASRKTQTTKRAKKSTAVKKPAATKKVSRRVVVLVATRKGAWLFHGDSARKTWKVNGPHFLGHIINHMVLDPRDGRTLL
ncbi:MAG TPA: glycosyl hydrolase, partial [Gammaproteobacteria bacterium]|nr:glycosyl hydrolase [Gammaproteobacteria bacterium]